MMLSFGLSFNRISEIDLPTYDSSYLSENYSLHREARRYHHSSILIEGKYEEDDIVLSFFGSQYWGSPTSSIFEFNLTKGIKEMEGKRMKQKKEIIPYRLKTVNDPEDQEIIASKNMIKVNSNFKDVEIKRSNIFSSFDSSIRSQTTNLVLDENKELCILLIGGYSTKKRTPNSNVYIGRLKNHKDSNLQTSITFDRLKMKNSIPSRFAHRTVCYEKKVVYLFGGTEELKEQDLFICDYQNKRWKTIEVKKGSKKPQGRFGQTMHFLQKNKIIMVFGATNSPLNSGVQAVNDCWVFDTHKLTWTEKITNNSWVSGRYGSTSVVQGHNIFIFGGMNEKNSATNELLSLNTKTWKWKRYKFSEYVFPLFSSTSIMYKRKWILIGGGSGLVKSSLNQNAPIYVVESDFFEEKKMESYNIQTQFWNISIKCEK